MQAKISAVLNTYNASLHLPQVLQHLKPFDEIVVCDMQSTDNTIAIAQSFGCKIVTFPKGQYTIPEPARNFAIQSASNPWVLVVDADEIIPQQLINYLYQKANSHNCPAGIFIPRKNYVLGQWIKSNYPDYQLRFVKKQGCDWPTTVHPDPAKVDGPTEHIPAQNHQLAMLHLSESVASHINKLNTYTDAEIVRKKVSTSILAMLFVPLYSFLRIYILKGSFRYGRIGFYQAIIRANYKFYIIMKAYEKKTWNNKKN